MTDKPTRDDPRPPIAAATVLLLRDGDDGLEVFMVVRHHEIDSFSGALVFPGGKVDPGDYEARQYCRGGDDVDDVALAFRIAAVREAFEECGVLLAYEGDGTEIVNAARTAELERAWREKLVKDEVAIGDVCKAENLTLAIDHMVHYAHWITPPVVPKVFDTHFFIARAPADQVALHDGEESTDSTWIRPAHALAAAEEGSRTVVFPTRMNLGKLSRWSTVEAALTAVADMKIVTVQPVVSLREGGRTLRIPAEADYGGTLFFARQDGDRMIGIEKLE
jgi:8-oxo-dGTP pyrophosphatase MutT (NUDIX family)